MNINNLIIQFIKDNKGFLIIYILFTLAYPLTSVILPKYYGNIIESLKQDQKTSFTYIILLLVLTTLMYGVLNRVDTIFIPKLQNFIRTNIVKIILNNYKDNFEEQELGSLISKVVKLPMIVNELFRQIRNYIIPLIIILIFVIIRFYMIDIKLGTIVLTGIIAGFSFLISAIRICLNKSCKLDNITDNVHESINEVFDNLLNIYSMNTINDEIKYIEDEQNFITNQYKKTFKHVNIIRTILNYYSIFLFFGIIIFSYKMFKRKKLILSDLISIIITSMYIIGKIGSFTGELPDLVFNLGIYNNIQEYFSHMNLTPDVKENLTITNGDIKFKNINIKYGDNHILQNFNLHIKPNDNIAIIGKIGTGKSSLVRCLLKLKNPTSGSILIDNVNIDNIDSLSLRSQIIYVPQNPIPFNRSLYDNITYGNKSLTKNMILDAFKKYDLYSFFGKHKLDSIVGRKGNNLSGGQRQMIFLLRILFNPQKKIIILDEPISSLDDITTQKITKLIHDIMHNRTVIIITHDKSLNKIVDRIISL